jgi:hypothetical protein
MKRKGRLVSDAACSGEYMLEKAGKKMGAET